jgi:hypothetical protein
MEIVVAMIALALVVAVAAYVAAPLTSRSRMMIAPEESPRERLLAERTTVLVAIRDLDFDFQTGKLLETDYRGLREKYAARGVEILKELDALPDGGRKLEVRGQKSADRDEIEAAVGARRKVKSQVAGRKEEDDIEAAVRARHQSQAQVRNQKSEIRNLKCPSCGRPIDSTDKFCAKCGAALSVEAAR